MVAKWVYSKISCDGGREVNEDSVACVPTASGLMLVVADGLGGHGKGEVASGLLTEVMSREFLANTEPLTEGFIPAAFETAQAELMQLQEERRATSEMKTTAAALVISADKAYWGHCGDTRLYYFRDSVMVERTLDHSVPQMLVLTGEIDEDEISGHPDRNKLLRVFGAPWESPRYQTGGPAFLSNKSAFLLCTDGFWEHITDKMMAEYLKKTRTAAEWLVLMKAEVEANGKGKKMDNYTAAVVRAVAE